MAMNQKTSTAAHLSTLVEWVWQSEFQSAEWLQFSDVENLIIEEAFRANQNHAILDGYYIDLKHNIQVADIDVNKQRPVRRMLRDRGPKPLRNERFMPDPIAPKRSFGGEYGWVSPFILEVRKDLKLKKDQLPSRDETVVSMIVQKAASGIIEEGEKLAKSREAAKLAQLLLEQKQNGMRKVWECCARMYSMESFLYKKLNEAMRSIGSEEHEQVWRSKVRTLGPFSLLLWDNPSNDKPNTIELVYRGAELSGGQLAAYEDLSRRPDDYGSFQSFTSCSRNRQIAELLGNVLFIMQVQYAFTMDLEPMSAIPAEEEELISPGVCFTVERVVYDKQIKKHLIYLTLKQRFGGEYELLFAYRYG
jgi:hypothetical protein